MSNLPTLLVCADSPQIITSPPNLDLFPGSNGELSCGTTGVPQPWTTWFKTANTGVMTELPTVGATFTKLATGLELHDVIREDSGVYECRVQNGIGSAMQTATVRVEGTFSIILITLNCFTHQTTLLFISYISLSLSLPLSLSHSVQESP